MDRAVNSKTSVVLPSSVTDKNPSQPKGHRFNTTELITVIILSCMVIFGVVITVVFLIISKRNKRNLETSPQDNGLSNSPPAFLLNLCSDIVLPLSVSWQIRQEHIRKLAQSRQHSSSSSNNNKTDRNYQLNDTDNESTTTTSRYHYQYENDPESQLILNASTSESSRFSRKQLNQLRRMQNDWSKRDKSNHMEQGLSYIQNTFGIERHEMDARFYRTVPYIMWVPRQGEGMGHIRDMSKDPEMTFATERGICFSIKDDIGDRLSMLEEEEYDNDYSYKEEHTKKSRSRVKIKRSQQKRYKNRNNNDISSSSTKVASLNLLQRRDVVYYSGSRLYWIELRLHLNGHTIRIAAVSNTWTITHPPRYDQTFPAPDDYEYRSMKVIESPWGTGAIYGYSVIRCIKYPLSKSKDDRKKIPTKMKITTVKEEEEPVDWFKREARMTLCFPQRKITVQKIRSDQISYAKDE